MVYSIRKRKGKREREKGKKSHSTPFIGSGGFEVKSSRDEPNPLVNLAMSPSICSVPHHVSNVRIVDM